MDRLDVFLHDDHIGALEWDRSDQRGTFTYADGYRRGADPTPLSLSMPLTAAQHRGAVVSAYLWGLLPDSNAVLERWARRFAVSLSNPMGLLREVGSDLPGAVSIVEPGGARTEAGDVRWLTEAEVEAQLVRLRRDTTEWLGSDGRWSLAGAQPKIALLERDGRWALPSARFATNRILKPAIVGLESHDLNEHLCMATARRLGLRAARTRVITFGSERALVVDRFDRKFSSDGNTEVRFHQEDMCQALGVHPAVKYQSDGGPAAAAVVGLLREQVDADHARQDIDTFVGALVFNWLIAAPDGHAKNFSVLMSGHSVRLAPLYDLASALPYDDFHAPKVKLAMKIGGHYRIAAIRASAWRRFASDSGLDPGEVIELATRLTEDAPSALAESVGALDDPSDPMARRLLDCVADRASECRRQLDHARPPTGS